MCARVRAVGPWVRRMSEPFLFTWSAQRGARGWEIVGGEGAFFELASGERWLDFGSLSYHANLGHGHASMIAAVKAQADRLCVSTPTAVYPEKRALAARLLDLAGEGYSKVFFTLGGAEANENAIKIARMVTGRFKTLSRYRSYHGASMGAVSLTGDYRRPPVEPALGGAVHALDCYCDRCPFGQRLGSCARECATHIEELLALEKGIGAVFLEPVPGANGGARSSTGVLAARRGRVPDARRAARGRRGVDRFRSLRRVVRASALGGAPRHDHVEQRPHRWLRGARRRDRARRDRRRDSRTRRSTQA